MNKGYCFTSEIFEITKGEDEATNPFCYGKSLAEWLYQKFRAIGYTNAELIPEDWGWCVMCSTNEVMLWVGCGVVQTEELMSSFTPENPPKGNQVVWHAFAHAEVPIFRFSDFIKKLLGKINLHEHSSKLENQLKEILNGEKSISFCQEP